MKPLAALIYLPTLESPGGIHFTTDMQNTPDQLCDVLVWLRKPTWQERNAGISSWLQQGCQVNAYDTAEEITQRTAQRAAEDLAITQKQREIAAEERRQRMLHLVEKADAEGTELADERQLERTRETRAQEDRAIAAFVGNTTEQLSQLGSCSAEAALPTNNDAFVWMDNIINRVQMDAWVAQAIPTFRRVTGLEPNEIWMSITLAQSMICWSNAELNCIAPVPQKPWQDTSLGYQYFSGRKFDLVAGMPGPEMMRLAHRQPNGARIIAQPASAPVRPRARDINEMGWNLEVRLERGQLHGYAWCISGGCKNTTPEFVCTVKETDDAPRQLLTAILGAIRSTPPADQIQAIVQTDEPLSTFWERMKQPKQLEPQASLGEAVKMWQEHCSNEDPAETERMCKQLHEWTAALPKIPAVNWLLDTEAAGLRGVTTQKRADDLMTELNNIVDEFVIAVDNWSRCTPEAAHIAHGDHAQLTRWIQDRLDVHGGQDVITRPNGLPSASVKAEPMTTWEYGQPVWFTHPRMSVRTPGYVMAVFNHRAVVEDEDGKREACETACLEPRPNKSHEPAGPFFQ